MGPYRPITAPLPIGNIMMSIVDETEISTAPTLASDIERWIAVTKRDPNADGIFYYSVSSTGV